MIDLKNNLKNLCKIMILVLIFNTVSFNKPTESLAGVWDNAYTYYNKYSNNSVFKATSDTNGYIYCGTKGNLSSSSIKYRTIGWKMKITDLKGNSLQTLYFKLGGNYLVMNHQVQKDNYDYRLYSISLYALKRRMNDTALDNIKKGNCKIILDACMIVVKDGVAGGKMNDSGVTSGKVYTTYKGISGAQNWSSSAKSSLKTYFGKKVEGLFTSVILTGTTGVSSVTGGGDYCHGTVVRISAEVNPGYIFKEWKGPTTIQQKSHLITVDVSNRDNQNWIAYADVGQCNIRYWSNMGINDKFCINKTYLHTVSGQRFESALNIPGETKRIGYNHIGWSEDRNANTVQYSYNGEIPTSSLISWGEEKDLYQVWIPNTYFVIFKSKKGIVAAREEKKYTDTIEIKNYGGAKKWYVRNPKAGLEYYCSGQAIKMSELVNVAGKGLANNQYITLYEDLGAKPKIEAKDLFYSVEAARKGKITEEEIASHAYAFDDEDGRISYGINSDKKNSFKLINFNPSLFTNINSPVKIKLTFQAIDSDNNSTSMDITINVVETKIEGEEAFGKLRFIDSNYYYKSEKNGGLLADSVWRLNKSYLDVISKIF